MYQPVILLFAACANTNDETHGPLGVRCTGWAAVVAAQPLRDQVSALLTSQPVSLTAQTDPLDPALNEFLERYAFQDQRSDLSQTHVALVDEQVVGFYTLVVSEIAQADAPARIIKGFPRYPVPVVVLARLAVSKDRQKQGLGSGLLKDAMLRILGAADAAGIRAIAVHAKDDAARAF